MLSSLASLEMLFLILSLVISYSWGFEINIDGISPNLPLEEVKPTAIDGKDNKFTKSIYKAFNSEFSNCMIKVEKKNQTYQYVELFNNDEKLLRCTLLNDIYDDCKDSGLKDNNFWYFQHMIESTCKDASNNEQISQSPYIDPSPAPSSPSSLPNLHKRLLDPKFQYIDFDGYYNKNLPRAMSYDCELMKALKTSEATESKIMTRYRSSFTFENGATETHITTLELIKVIDMVQPSMMMKRHVDDSILNTTFTSSCADDKLGHNQHTLLSTLLFTFILTYMVFELSSDDMFIHGFATTRH